MTRGRNSPRASDEPQVLPLRPLKPQKRLFIVLGVVMAAWIVCLIVMYFTTVRGHR